jgi:hypothetical protein
VNKAKAWDDVKITQTTVFVENNIDKTVRVYMPSKDNFSSLDSQRYKDSKTAMDSVSQKYVETLNSQFKGIAFIPVESIKQDITLEEYREAAKNITPVCEYT